jgi:hypothetical protein
MAKAPNLLIVAVLSLQCCNSSQAQDAQSQGPYRQQVPGGGGYATKSWCLDLLGKINRLENTPNFPDASQQIAAIRQTFVRDNCQTYGFRNPFPGGGGYGGAQRPVGNYQVPGGGGYGYGGPQRPVGNYQVPDGGGYATNSRCLDMLDKIKIRETMHAADNRKQLAFDQQWFSQHDCQNGIRNP